MVNYKQLLSELIEELNRNCNDIELVQNTISARQFSLEEKTLNIKNHIDVGESGVYVTITCNIIYKQSGCSDLYIFVNKILNPDSINNWYKIIYADFIRYMLFAKTTEIDAMDVRRNPIIQYSIQDLIKRGRYGN